MSEVRVRSTEVVLFGSFLRICHCAKLMERLGLAALLCRGAFFARHLAAASPSRLLLAYYSLLPLLLFFCFSWRTATGIFFLEFLLFLPSTSKEKKEKLRIRRKWKMGFSIFFSWTNSWLLAQTDETHVTLKPPSQALLEILYRLICQSCKRQTVLQQVCFLHKEDFFQYVHSSKSDFKSWKQGRYRRKTFAFMTYFSWCEGAQKSDHKSKLS